MHEPYELSQISYKLYQVDAFTNRIFGGNPAAVCVLPRWLPASILQQIATENNLPETAFCVKNGYLYDIRWFTPTTEVDICGHATLASAHVLFQHEGDNSEEIIFNAKLGQLVVRKDRLISNRYTLDLPLDKAVFLDELPADLAQCLGPDFNYNAILKARKNYVLVLHSEADLLAFSPNLDLLKKVKDTEGIMATAPGEISDFVVRCFFPIIGIDEDPVTGSAFASIVPYWAEQLGVKEMEAIQLSERRGHLACLLQETKVSITGFARTYLQGTIFIQ